MISNITNRNISMILAVSSFAGLLYCIYSTIYKSTNWSLLCPIVIAIVIFTKFYLTYRKEVKKGNIYGSVNPFK